MITTVVKLSTKAKKTAINNNEQLEFRFTYQVISKQI